MTIVDPYQLKRALMTISNVEREIERVATIGNKQWVRCTIRTRGPYGELWINLQADHRVFPDGRGVRCLSVWTGYDVDKAVAAILDAAPARAKKRGR